MTYAASGASAAADKAGASGTAGASGNDCGAYRLPMLIRCHLLKAALFSGALGALLLPAAAQAHDTWFQALPASGGAPLLALGTGSRFPVQESGIGVEYLARQGCTVQAPGTGANAPKRRSVQPVIQPMKPLRNMANALVLRGPAQAQSCWVQLVPLEIELQPDKVPIYLQEVQADAALRAAWALIQQRGLPWKERYTKHARIDLRGNAAELLRMDLGAGMGTGMGTGTGTGTGSGVDMDMDMDIVRAAAADGAFSFRVIRDGLPLPGLAVEFVSDKLPLGIWRRSDEQGLVSLPTLPPGRWLVRAIDLRLSTVRPDEWESRFVSLAFDVSPPAAAPAAPPAAPSLTPSPTPPPR